MGLAVGFGRQAARPGLSGYTPRPLRGQDHMLVRWVPHLRLPGTPGEVPGDGVRR